MSTQGGPSSRTLRPEASAAARTSDSVRRPTTAARAAPSMPRAGRTPARGSTPFVVVLIVVPLDQSKIRTPRMFLPACMSS